MWFGFWSWNRSGGRAEAAAGGLGHGAEGAGPGGEGVQSCQKEEEVGCEGSGRGVDAEAHLFGQMALVVVEVGHVYSNPSEFEQLQAGKRVARRKNDG